jgi:hypothetical protein
MALAFDRSGWTEAEIGTEWTDDVQWLKDLGYSGFPFARLGEECGVNVCIHESDPTQKMEWEFFVWFNTSCYWKAVFVKDLPSLLRLINEFLPLIGAVEHWEAVEEARELAKESGA